MFIYLVCVGVCDCVCHESTGVHGLQKRVLDPQQLELQAPMSCQTLVLGTEHRDPEC